MMNDIFTFLLPVLTALIAWLGNAYRNKQKKEKDIIDNVQQILDIQKAFIGKQEETINKTNETLDAVNRKLSHKTAAIKRAYNCPTPSEECPVLQFDLTWDDDKCFNCRKQKEEKKHD